MSTIEATITVPAPLIRREGPDGSAAFSPCERYRYALNRRWREGLPVAVWVMLNPSTADHEQLDPTIRRCVGFSKSWGCSGLIVVNAYALRSTDPKGLWREGDPVGPHNDLVLRKMAAHAADGAKVIAAWGANIKPDREREVYDLLRAHGPVYCLGTTKAGHPKHPLYLRADTELREFEMGGGEG